MPYEILSQEKEYFTDKNVMFEGVAIIQDDRQIYISLILLYVLLQNCIKLKIMMQRNLWALKIQKKL